MALPFGWTGSPAYYGVFGGCYLVPGDAREPKIDGPEQFRWRPLLWIRVGRRPRARRSRHGQQTRTARPHAPLGDDGNARSARHQREEILIVVDHA